MVASDCRNIRSEELCPQAGQKKAEPMTAKRQPHSEQSILSRIGLDAAAGNVTVLGFASTRMVIKRRGAARPVVAACTLLPYDDQFAMGATLAEAGGTVMLNHPHCARFCVLGGASCSA